jgi:hypothetical protein
MLLFTQRSLKMQLIIIFISAFGLCNAQVQISNFPNDTLKKPNSFDLKFSTKTKAYFTAFKPEAGNELWVTDGLRMVLLCLMIFMKDQIILLLVLL